jgi:hypothetical protein
MIRDLDKTSYSTHHIKMKIRYAFKRALNLAKTKGYLPGNCHRYGDPLCLIIPSHSMTCNISPFYLWDYDTVVISYNTWILSSHFMNKDLEREFIFKIAHELGHAHQKRQRPYLVYIVQMLLWITVLFYIPILFHTFFQITSGCAWMLFISYLKLISLMLNFDSGLNDYNYSFTMYQIYWLFKSIPFIFLNDLLYNLWLCWLYGIFIYLLAGIGVNYFRRKIELDADLISCNILNVNSLIFKRNAQLLFKIDRLYKQYQLNIFKNIHLIRWIPWSIAYQFVCLFNSHPCYIKRIDYVEKHKFEK